MTDKVIWAKWQVHEDGRVDVTATYEQDGSYIERSTSYESVDEAAAAFGPSFRDVVTTAVRAGSSTGRWRP